MDEIENIQSGADYAKLIIDDIILNENELTNDEKVPLPLLNYWCEEIELYADETWHWYVTGKREHFIFDEDEFTGLFEKAGMRYAGEVLDGLVDEGMVDVLVRDDGEIIYKTSEKGNEELNKNNNE